MDYWRLHTPNGSEIWLPADSTNRALLTQLAVSTGGWVEARRLTEAQRVAFEQAPGSATQSPVWQRWREWRAADPDGLRPSAMPVSRKPAISGRVH